MNTNIITYGGAIAGGVLLSKIAKNNNRPVLMVAICAVSGLAIGAGVSDLVMLKTGVKKNEGFMDLVAPIYIISGIGLLGFSEIVYRIAK